MEFDTNLNLNLEQLENDIWGEPNYDSYVVIQCHKLRKIPLNQMNAENCRLLIGQKISLKYIVPMAIQLLSENAFVEGTFFNVDLLLSVLNAPFDFGHENQSLFMQLQEIMCEVIFINNTLQNSIMPQWERLCLTQLNETQNITDKEKLVKKYCLKLEDGCWYSQKENSHKHLIFKDTYFQKQDILGLLFRINKLCFAKVKYFRQNIDKFEPYKYDYKLRFIKTELWDSEFLKHIASGYIIDYRYLQSITVYSDFIKLCDELDSFK